MFGSRTELAQGQYGLVDLLATRSGNEACDLLCRDAKGWKDTLGCFHSSGGAAWGANQAVY